MAEKKTAQKGTAAVVKSKEKKECFAIMPIGDQGDTSAEHFKRVYEDIIKPACVKAGYSARRADEDDGTNLIQQKILKSIIDAPVCVCDLSCLNPNVLFELGIRQAFDLPVVLIKDHLTDNIFDIQGLRYQEYNKNLRYHDVVNFQQKLADAIETTVGEKEDNIANSIIRLVDLVPATRDESVAVDSDSLVRLLLSEINDVKSRLISNNHKSSSARQARLRGMDVDDYREQRMKDYSYGKDLLERARRCAFEEEADALTEILSEIDKLCSLYEHEITFRRLLMRARNLEK